MYSLNQDLGADAIATPAFIAEAEGPALQMVLYPVRAISIEGTYNRVLFPPALSKWRPYRIITRADRPTD